MNPDDIVEAFVSTIIIVVMLIVAITIWKPDIGMVLADLLPTFVEIMLWVFVGVFVIAILSQFVDEF